MVTQRHGRNGGYNTRKQTDAAKNESNEWVQGITSFIDIPFANADDIRMGYKLG